MAINLQKGQRINLEKDNGARMSQFCVGCNWGGIPVHKKGFLGFGGSTEIRDVDLDLSCVVIDGGGNMIDHIYSPLYRKEFLGAYGMPAGKLESKDGALRHSGDDLKGDSDDGDDGLDNEIITVNLDKIAPEAAQIFFFLNNAGKEDFEEIPYASIRMFEGSPQRVNEVFAKYDVTAEPAFKNKRALIMGRLYKKDNNWKFNAIGDATDDPNLCETINRIKKDYIR